MSKDYGVISRAGGEQLLEQLEAFGMQINKF